MLNLNYKETETSEELTLYVLNEGRMYRCLTVGIIKNLAKKYEKGTFETEKALKSFYNLATEGAKRYAKEYANADEWNKIFSVANRKACACELLEGYWENINGENPIY